MGSKRTPKLWKAWHQGKKDPAIDDTRAIAIAEEEEMVEGLPEKKNVVRKALIKQDEMYDIDMEIGKIYLQLDV